MSIPLAFYSPHVDAPAAAWRLRAAPRRPLPSPPGDVLWRLTTPRWARARTAAPPVPPYAWRDRLEAAITTASLLGMGLMTWVCLTT